MLRYGIRDFLLDNKIPVSSEVNILLTHQQPNSGYIPLQWMRDVPITSICTRQKDIVTIFTTAMLDKMAESWLETYHEIPVTKFSK